MNAEPGPQASTVAELYACFSLSVLPSRVTPPFDRNPQKIEGRICLQIAYPFIYGMPPLNWLLRKLRPSQGIRVLVPSPMLRAVTFKLFVDMSQIPALQYLFSTGLQVLFSGDKSQWDRALQMPHYNTASMPAISWHTGMHFGQVRPSASNSPHWHACVGHLSQGCRPQSAECMPVSHASFSRHAICRSMPCTI